MPDSEVLVGIAALGLTVTGFSGLISVLGRRSAGHWSEAERFQLGELIVVSLAVTFAAFIPVLIAMVQDGERAILTAALLVAIAHALVLGRGVVKNYRGGVEAPNLPNGLVAFMVLGGLVLIVATFMAGFSLLPGAAFLIVANLLWQLMVACTHFVLLLMNPASDQY